MSLTIALRTMAVLSCAVALGETGCTYEYDRFKLDNPDATAGRSGSSVYGGGMTEKGPGGGGHGGVSASQTTANAGAAATDSGFGGVGNSAGGVNTGEHSLASGGTTLASTTGASTSGGINSSTATAHPTVGGGGIVNASSTSGGTTIGGRSSVDVGGTTIGGTTIGGTTIGGTTIGGTTFAATGGTSQPTSAAGASGRCLLPFVECSGTCVDLANNPDHCGACGHACFQASASWAVCIERVCSCDGGATKCGAGATCQKKDACVGSAK